MFDRKSINPALPIVAPRAVRHNGPATAARVLGMPRRSAYSIAL